MFTLAFLSLVAVAASQDPTGITTTGAVTDDMAQKIAGFKDSVADMSAEEMKQQRELINQQDPAVGDLMKQLQSGDLTQEQIAEMEKSLQMSGEMSETQIAAMKEQAEMLARQAKRAMAPEAMSTFVKEREEKMNEKNVDGMVDVAAIEKLIQSGRQEGMSQEAIMEMVQSQTDANPDLIAKFLSTLPGTLPGNLPTDLPTDGEKPMTDAAALMKKLIAANKEKSKAIKDIVDGQGDCQSKIVRAQSVLGDDQFCKKYSEDMSECMDRCPLGGKTMVCDYCATFAEQSEEYAQMCRNKVVEGMKKMDSRIESWSDLCLVSSS